MIHRDEGQELDAKNFKICDFGLVMTEDARNCIYKRCGTPGFVPPEIIKVDNDDFEAKVSRKWDTFSVGVILYMLISSLTSPSRIQPLPVVQRKRNPSQNRRLQGELQPQPACQAVGAK